MYVLGMYVSPPPSPHPSPRGRFGRLLLSVGGGYPATGFSRSSVDSRPRRFVARTVLSLDNIGTSYQHLTFRLSHNQQNPKPTFDLARRASRPPNYILQCSFFFFARMSCSEQSAFHGQAADPVWFFSELLFQSVAAKKKGKKRKNIDSTFLQRKTGQHDLEQLSDDHIFRKKICILSTLIGNLSRIILIIFLNSKPITLEFSRI